VNLLGEPLLHFAVAGAILFGAWSAVGGGADEGADIQPVFVTAGDVGWLRQTWASQWLREPTAEELSGLVAEFVDEQLLAREAEELGLAKDDTVVRRRLAQKLRFLVEDTGQLADPTEEELVAFQSAHPDRFAMPSRLSFRQVYFNPSRRRDALADAKAALAGLIGPAAGDASAMQGDSLLIGDEFSDVDEEAVARMFGGQFAGSLIEIEPGAWSGPVESGYGVHLVLVKEREAGRPRAFEEVRDAVAAEWRSRQQEALVRDYLARLRAKYGVEIDDGVSATLDPGPQPEVARR
jgi:hypothetical protein